MLCGVNAYKALGTDFVYNECNAKHDEQQALITALQTEDEEQQALITALQTEN